MSDGTLRTAMLSAMKIAHADSKAPGQGSAELAWHAADHSRLRSFIEHLAGKVRDTDASLAESLMAFVEAWPGDKLELKE